MRTATRGEKKSGVLELPLTPMIDIVFLLLVFFIMTFRIVAQEGDFRVRMPQAARSGLPGLADELPPLRVRLTAAEDGSLREIALGDLRFSEFSALRSHIVAILGDDRGPGSVQDTAEVELQCDFHLRYEHAVQAITAVSGYVAEGEIVTLVEKIKFLPPAPP